MKLTAFLLLIVATFCEGQAVQTTTDEYNYLTKGLKRTLEEGADGKTGYTLGEPLSIKHESGNYEFTLAPFTKTASKTVVAMSVIVKSSLSGYTYYLCIPRGNAELLKLYWADMRKLDGSINRAYAEVASYLMGEAMGLAETQSLQKK